MSAITHGASHAGRCDPSRSGQTTKPSLIRRLVDAIVLARQRRADREIAQHFGLSGGRLTDDIERRISEHITGQRPFRP
jgi:methylphosphotriester-DNA--protein-cysteine methyltransferase